MVVDEIVEMTRDGERSWEVGGTTLECDKLKVSKMECYVCKAPRTVQYSYTVAHTNST